MFSERTPKLPPILLYQLATGRADRDTQVARSFLFIVVEKARVRTHIATMLRGGDSHFAPYSWDSWVSSSVRVSGWVTMGVATPLHMGQA